jgi:hypothetical protein
MLIEFSVGNYRSFQGIVTFSMRAAKLRAKNKQLDEEMVFSVKNRLNLLKSAAIYGANASGKSNLIAALRFMQQMVLTSAQRQSSDATGTSPFALNIETENAPSYFQAVFALNGSVYRYGFELDREKIHAEWLYHHRQRETALFLREGQDFKISSVFKEGLSLDSKTRPNALFLSVVDQFNGKIAGDILTWFKRQLRIISGLNDEEYLLFTAKRMEQEPFRTNIVAFVKELDVGIIDIQQSLHQIEVKFPNDIPEELRAFLPDTERFPIKIVGTQFNTLHKKYVGNEEAGNAMFDLSQESEGTRKLFFLAGLLLDTLNIGAVLFIDEFDARLHPLLCAKIAHLFNSRETNPHNAQLVFATHDTNLLDKNTFRRDQIWFTEKNRYGATDLYSLAEYSVRNDASYAKDYIAGKYGAIPYLGNIERLIERAATDHDKA